MYHVVRTTTDKLEDALNEGYGLVRPTVKVDAYQWVGGRDWVIIWRDIEETIEEARRRARRAPEPLQLRVYLGTSTSMATLGRAIRDLGDQWRANMSEQEFGDLVLRTLEQTFPILIAQPKEDYADQSDV